jgi:hypothetical protein
MSVRDRIMTNMKNSVLLDPSGRRSAASAHRGDSKQTVHPSVIVPGRGQVRGVRTAHPPVAAAEVKSVSALELANKNLTEQLENLTAENHDLQRDLKAVQALYHKTAQELKRHQDNQLMAWDVLKAGAISPARSAMSTPRLGAVPAELRAQPKTPTEISIRSPPLISSVADLDSFIVHSNVATRLAHSIVSPVNATHAMPVKTEAARGMPLPLISHLSDLERFILPMKS